MVKLLSTIKASHHGQVTPVVESSMADRVFPLDRQHTDGVQHYTKRFPRGAYPLPPAYNRELPRHRRRFCCCCCYICAVLATLFLILFVLTATLYLLLQPKVPTFSIKRAYITEFNVTGAEPAKQPRLYLQTNLNFTVVAGNPNKKIGVHYEQINVELDYETVEIGKGSVLSLYVGERESEEMELQVKGEHILLEKGVGLGLQRAVQVGSSLWVQIKTVARVHIRVWGFQSRNAKIRIHCTVHLSSPLPGRGAHLLSNSCKLHSLTFWHLNDAA